MNYYALLKKELDEKHLPYNELKDGVIEIYQKKENIQSVRIIVGFDSVESNRPWFKCYDLGHFDDDKYAAGLLACNEANKKYRWMRFYIDSDNDVTVDADAIVSEESVFEEVIEIIVRMLDIVNDVYPMFMKARWA